MKTTIKIVAWCILVVALILFIEFLAIAIKNNEFNEYFTMIISTISIFATFGGAYLGAKISGDNSRKLYEQQRKEKEKEVVNKIDLIVNIKLIKVWSHSKIAENTREILYVRHNDHRSYEEIMNNNIMYIDELIDGYAKPTIELLEDKEIHKGNPRLFKSLLKMFNECNRMYYHIKQVDITDQSGNIPEDNSNLNNSERNSLQNLAHKYRKKVKKEILVNFVEFLFVKEILDDCAENILKNTTKENNLVNDIDFKKYNNMKYTINL
ncbi:hypothetical protein [Staphylococcus hominis]|uniref:hypothetical protein n=1 Tax=Staphylococcus hominis TaxID=1290 RepID=UPI0022E32DEF|nr:hypothetical protein [Staphylococcus hominis]